MNLGVHVDNDALRSESLRAVRRDNVTVIAVPHLVRVEAHNSVFCAIHADADFAVVSDVLDGAKTTNSNVQVSLRSCKLYPVSNGKFPLDLTVRGDAAQP